MDALMDVATLAKHLEAPNWRVFDASWYLPAMGRDPEAEFLAGSIPGAQRFDFDGVITDQSSSLPHMLPPPDELQQHLRALGVNAGDTIVVYDGAGVFSSPRAWWMLRAAGHPQVAVLNGGLPAWRAAGLPLEAGETTPTANAGNITVSMQPNWIATEHDVERALAEPGCAVVDARPAARFAGAVEEPRPGLRRGHMPGAVSLPADALVVAGQMLDRSDIEAQFGAHAAREQRLICSCGSGVTAAILALGATVAGYERVAVYDGSWAEWGRPDGPPVASD